MVRARRLRESPRLRSRQASPTGQVGLDDPTVLMTAPGVLLGTVLYMAPEQVRGLPVDARADVWAFGCVLYEMVTGQSPFIGKTTADILAAVLDREPAPPASFRTDAPPALTAIITRALAKDPAQRFQAMAEVADALRAVGRSLDARIPSGGHRRGRNGRASTRRSTARGRCQLTRRRQGGAIQTRDVDGVGDRRGWPGTGGVGAQGHQCRRAACAAVPRRPHRR